LVQTANTGKLPTGGALYTAVRKAGNISMDKGISVPLLKYYTDNQ